MSLAIVDYRPTWPSEFAAIGALLRRGLGARALRIDHIGSTAVPGLPAKDVIDIQLTVATLDDGDGIAGALAALGFAAPEGTWRDHPPAACGWSERDCEKRFLREAPGTRRVNLHVRTPDRRNQAFPLLFRDYLRARPEAAAAYAALKRQLARFTDDIGVYCDIKDPAVDLIHVAARDWAQAIGWRQGPSDA